MNSQAFELIKKYARQLGAIPGHDASAAKIMVNLNGRIYETEDNCDFLCLQPKDVSIVSGAMGAAYSVEYRLLKDNPQIQVLVLSNTTYCRAVSAYGKTLTASVDDTAQIVGPKIFITEYEEKDIRRALRKASGCFVRGKYTLTTGRNLYEAVVALEVLEKAAEIDLKASVIGGAKPLSMWEAKKMRKNYQKNYSKAEQEIKSAEGRI